MCNMLKLLVPVALCLAVASLWSCAGPGTGSATRGSTTTSRSQGTVLTYSPATIWPHARRVVQASSGNMVLDESAMRAIGLWGDGPLPSKMRVEVSVEPFDSAGRKAILRVRAWHSETGANDPQLAESILLAIQQSLLTR
ncbi:MAG: hypothetical protein CMJ98_07140 [Planctomycetes bacterium]|nr:hypothetical protein [Planctomycetota bacterium]MBV21312.1 hypothetical protein [Planctomycetaceae bacterium]HJM57464.1 hypothetical protein [Planctomycetota bacterium]